MSSTAAQKKQRCSVAEKSLLQAVVDAHLEATWICDSKGKCIVCNAAADKIDPQHEFDLFADDGMISLDQAVYRAESKEIMHKAGMVLRSLIPLDLCSAKIRLSTERLTRALLENQ